MKTERKLRVKNEDKFTEITFKIYITYDHTTQKQIK